MDEPAARWGSASRVTSKWPRRFTAKVASQSRALVPAMPLPRPNPTLTTRPGFGKSMYGLWVVPDGVRPSSSAGVGALPPPIWLNSSMFTPSPLTAATDGRAARLALLERIDIPFATQEHYQELGGDLLSLVHSYAHRTIRRLATFAGIERDGLAEYLLPHHLAFVVYAASRGDFVLGGLQAVFETSLHRFLADLVEGESRCALDPGCRSGGGACMACLHLGEPSCRWFNRFLDRSELFGQHGFLFEAG